MATYYVEVQVQLPDGNSEPRALGVGISDEEDLGSAIVDVLNHFEKSQKELPEEEREWINIIIDPRTPLEQCLCVSVEDENGQWVPIPLDRTLPEIGVPEEAVLRVTPGMFVVGANLKGGPGNGGNGGPPRRPDATPSNLPRFKQPGAGSQFPARGAPVIGRPPVTMRDEHREPAPVEPASHLQSPRIRRVKEEVEQLIEFANQNPSVLRIDGPRQIHEVWNRAKPLDISLLGIDGWVLTAEGEAEVRNEHRFRIVFPMGYPFDRSFRVLCHPSAPPLFHPNVSPNGDPYICLYPETEPPHRRNLVQAMQRLEAVVQWRTANMNDIDAMNKDARTLWDDPNHLEMRDLQGPRLHLVRLMEGVASSANRILSVSPVETVEMGLD